jgi:hypothetical protein
VGERGVKLSGGQRQRVALARVMLKNAPILILDEATSALDSEVEAAIQETLYGMMEGKTVIAIAHRLSTIAHMDRIIVLDDGRIVEDGPHDALLEKGGLYARLWARQSGGFIGTKSRRRRSDALDMDPFDPRGGRAAASRWRLLRCGARRVLAAAVGSRRLRLGAGGTMEVVSAILLGAVVDAALQTGMSDFFRRKLAPSPGLPSSTSRCGRSSSGLSRPRTRSWSRRTSAAGAEPSSTAGHWGRPSRSSTTTSRDARAEADAGSARRDGGGERDDQRRRLRAGLAPRLGRCFLIGIGWVALALAVWLVAYLALIRASCREIRKHGPTARAAARAMITGQVVDTITNIKTVKLFAHHEHEDRAALTSMGPFGRALLRSWCRPGSGSRSWRMAGALPVILIGGTLILWSQRWGDARRHRGGRRDLDPDRADVGLGQHDADGDLRKRGRGRGRHEDPDAALHAPDSARRRTELGRVRGEILLRGRILCLWARGRRGREHRLTSAGGEGGDRRRVGGGEIDPRGAAPAALRPRAGRDH